MATRLSSTKLRAKRIELDYFARRHPLRTWRVVLSLAGLALPGVWVARELVRNDERSVEPGPVSVAHGLFGNRCTACHGEPAVQPTAAAAPVARGLDRPRWLGATDAACRRCHDAADHETNQTDAPSCASCHAEHRGQRVLRQVSTARCVQCHGELEAHARSLIRVVGSDGRAVQGLADGHPEFAVWVGRGPEASRVRLDATPAPADRAQVRLNHELHLKPGLRGPAGAGGVQLACGDCHQGPMALSGVRFAGTPPPVPSPGDAPDLIPAEEPSYMAPVRFVRHCAGCHPNTFDARFADLPAPHDRPEVIHAFLRGAYANYLVTHADELVDPRRSLLGRETTVQSADAWVNDQVREAETLLFRDPKRCQECHVLSWEPGAVLPTVAPTELPVRWLPQSRFDHGTHRLLACTECHAAPASERTEDILMPRRATCQRCHHAGGASDRCSECHTYHGVTGPVEMNGGRVIARLLDEP